MRPDEVATIFSVYRIWLQDAQAPAGDAAREASDVVRVVEKPLRRTKHHCDAVDIFRADSPSLATS